MKASIVQVTLKLVRIKQNKDKTLPETINITDITIACEGYPSKMEYAYREGKENFIHPSTLGKIGINYSTKVMIDYYQLDKAVTGKSLGFTAFEVDDTYKEIRKDSVKPELVKPKQAAAKAVAKEVTPEITEVFNDDDWG